MKPYSRMYTVTVAGEERARAVIDRLITASCCFSVSPLPDDAWEITTLREDAAITLQRVIAEVEQP